MKTIAGSGSQTINRDGGERQVSIVSLDSVSTMNIKINGDTTGMTVEPSGRRGWRVNNRIYQVIVTATGNWEITFQ